MFHVLLILAALTTLSPIESVTIKYPSNAHIEERVRKNINPILRYYVIPREIQFHADAIVHPLPYFLQCKGSSNSVNFTIPPSATGDLSLNTNQQTHTITAKLRRNKLTFNLVGRYTCSEKVNNKDEKTTAYVFIQNDRSVFTKTVYPTVFKQTGIHFFNLPCQTTSWHPQMSCPSSYNSRGDLCIPIYYTPSNLNSQKVLFDPQIGFALENPTLSNQIRQFTCQSKSTPSEESRIPFDSSEPPFLKIHQPSFTVMKGETAQLSCEIQYGINLEPKKPRIFWFEDIHNLQLIFNKTEPQVHNSTTRLYSRKSVIKLKGFKPGEVYRFYCVRESNGDVYSRSVDITCAKDSIPISLVFKTKLPDVSRLNRNANEDVKLDCTFDGLPRPKVVWLRGKLPLKYSESTYQLKDNNGSLLIHRVRAIDTGYYTCLLNNSRNQALKRSFHLIVQDGKPYSRFSRISAWIIIISVLLLLITFIVLIVLACRYCRMIQNVKEGMYPGKPTVGVEDETQPPIVQLDRIALPHNFASRRQIHTFLSYVNGKHSPATPEDFKELGRGQFGVVYQVNLPDVGLVAAKILPESIRNVKHHREKKNKSDDVDENEEMISKQELRKKKAAEMLIDEIKVMHKAGTHVNIVALKKVAYPEAKFKFLFTGGPIAEEDSFYLMELCANGSLESMLKRFLQPAPNSVGRHPSLYETLSQQPKSGMTVTEAYERCVLTDDDLKLIAYQVASGLDYLNRRQIAHCDIAPRNVLVTARFIMKICDFGLATWTTYKNYREQLEENNSVQLEKKSNEIATHNLTPELARAILRASNPDEQLLLNKSSIKSDVWSFGIFLWMLFLKCRIRPFNRLLEETKRTSSGDNFFHRLARMISEGGVLRYIDYHNEIPRDIYGIIRDCLVEETHRPEMTRIRAYLCHSDMLSKRAFEYYRSEYNQYQEENSIDGNVEVLPEVQGVSGLPLFEGEYGVYENPPLHDSLSYRPSMNDNMYYAEPVEHVYETVKKPSSPKATTESNPPPIYVKKRAPIKPPVPPRRPTPKDDSYL